MLPSAAPFALNAHVTQLFGDTHQRYTALGLLGHNGVDFALPLHTPLYAVVDGEVVEVGNDPYGFGFYVKMRTTDGEDWLQAHMEHYHLPEPGEWLAAGAPIGFSGSSGMSTGPHVHIGYRPQWWVRSGGYAGYADPYPYLLPLFATA